MDELPIKDAVKAIARNVDQETLISLQKFQALLNREPEAQFLRPTPDGKAKYLPIGIVEMYLDEIFFGLWSTENFHWSGIANEVQGSLELVLTHPVTGQQIRKTGAASIVVMVDKLDDADKAQMTAQQRNMYATDVSNKKPNALDLGFPKLKAECLKNAAQSLGKRFGRDINRRDDVTKPYSPMINKQVLIELEEEKLLMIAENIGNPATFIEGLETMNLAVEQKEFLRTKAMEKMNIKISE